MMVITGGVGQGKLAYALERTGLGEGDVAYTAAQAWDKPIFAGVTGWIREALARGRTPTPPWTPCWTGGRSWF